MLNIISRAYFDDRTTGPKKVIDNLIQGLHKLKYPFVMNRALNACRRLFIMDDTFALRKLASLPSEIKVIVGPWAYLLPQDIPAAIDLARCLYLQPSPWAKDFWVESGFHSCPVEAWPAGIDTDLFRERGLPQKEHVILYFKERFAHELSFVENVLKEKHMDYTVITYGAYQEKTYRELLKKTSYIIWLGRQESQGIALQEAMAMNVPVIVCDVTAFGHMNNPIIDHYPDAQKNFDRATAAYFFDEHCGIKLTDLTALPAAIETMRTRLSRYTPRSYIQKHLGLEKQAKDLLNLYQEHFGLSLQAGYQEKLLSKGYWINSFRPFQLLVNRYRHLRQRKKN